jgi:DNA (cytosine-5)-methyltransferase 1
MENVKGLLSANLDGESIFHKIINDLKFPNSIFKTDETAEYEIYSVVKSSVKTEKDFVVKSEQYGIPQKRHRIFLVGVRKDIQKRPSLLKPHSEEITLESVIGSLPPIRSGMSRSFKQSRLVEGKKKRTYQTVGDADDTWSELLNSFKETVFSWSGFKETDLNGRIHIPKHGKGAEFIECNDTLSEEHPLYSWYIDPKLNGIANHESRSHLVEDLKRYFFSSLFTKKYKRFPRLSDYASHSKQLMPDHENAKTGKFNDRFRVQLRNAPATTITSHISKDGHYFIHYDTKQCRSLTVREAARIQTFPDNYLFCGSRTQQFHQVGNAVPPYLAKQIGDLIKKLLI